MHLPRFAVALLALALLQGCFSSDAKPEFYYQLGGPAGIRKKGKGPRILMATFTAASGYDSPRMIYRTSEHEVGYYAYHKWMAEPPRLVGEQTSQHLNASGQFALVAGPELVREPDAVLEGVVEAMEEIDKGDSWEARLAVRFLLRRAHSDEVLLQHAFDARVPCKERHPREVARGVSTILAKEAKTLAEAMAGALTAAPAAPVTPANATEPPRPPPEEDTTE